MTASVTAVATGPVTGTISMPWAAVNVAGAIDASAFEPLQPYASWVEERSASGADGSGPPVVATVRFERLERCMGTEDAEGPGGEPVVLHQKHRGTIHKSDFGHLVINHSCGVHYHLELGSPPSVTCCVAGGRPGVDALQIVRGLLVGVGVGTEGLAPLHGAVLSTEGGDGVLLAGGKNAGKTSFALGLLALAGREGVALVSNDKVLLDARTLRAYGLPYAITMHDGTLSQLPALAGRPRRSEGGKSLFWPADVAAAMEFRLLPSVVLREQWWCELDLSRLGAVLRSAPPPDNEGDTLSKFTSNLLPVWLLELFGLWTPRAPVREIDLPASRVAGNPWRSWLPRPPHELW